MGVRTKHMRCNEQRCQRSDLGKRFRSLLLQSSTGGEDGKGTQGKRTRTKVRSWGLSSELNPRPGPQLGEQGSRCQPFLPPSKHRHHLPALPSRHLVTIDGDLDNTCRGWLVHALPVFWGHGRGSPEEDQSKCGDASSHTSAFGPLLQPPGRLGVFLQEWRVAGQARQMWTQREAGW